VILCEAARPEHLLRRAEAERVTATLGLTVDGIRELGRPA
jgi:hypothetical protein